MYLIVRIVCFVCFVLVLMLFSPIVLIVPFMFMRLLILTIKVNLYMLITPSARRVLGVYARVCFVLSH